MAELSAALGYQSDSLDTLLLIGIQYNPTGFELIRSNTRETVTFFG